MSIHAKGAPALVNGSGTAYATAAEVEEFYAQLWRLRDAVVSGTHPQFKLSPAAIGELKATLTVSGAPVPGNEQPRINGHMNGGGGGGGGRGGASSEVSVITNKSQLAETFRPPPAFSGLPGLHTPATPTANGTTHQALTTKPTPSRGLDPMFLEKSPDLIRAEAQLKRQRIERELQLQTEQRKHTARNKDPAGEAPFPMDIEAVLTALSDNHVSGLKPEGATGEASSFDENDYYSSRVQSEWSSPASAVKGAQAVVSADMARPVQHADASSSAKRAGKQAFASRDLPLPQSRSRAQAEVTQIIDVDAEDDRYSPPAASTFAATYPAPTLGDLADDDDSEYEPGEIAQDEQTLVDTHPVALKSPQVPIIRNHLTHIAAPQPSRVSPLAVAKGPSGALRLVNGCPEMVPKVSQRKPAPQRRASTASSVNPKVGALKKKPSKKALKRKRIEQKEEEKKAQAERRAYKKRRRESRPAVPQSPRIKDEPMSPPPFVNVPEARSLQYRPVEIDLVSPRASSHAYYAYESPQSGLRYAYADPSGPPIVRMSSPAMYRPAQRDIQDLRRVASLQYAQRPPSPAQRVYSPAQPYRAVSMAYGDPRGGRAITNIEPTRYQELPSAGVRYAAPEGPRSPPREQEYYGTYASRASSVAPMPLPAAPARPIVVDQYGNRYYAAEPEPPSVAPRMSMAPVERRPAFEPAYERAPSRLSMVYAQPQTHNQPEPVDHRMAPPPLPASNRRQILDDQPVQYIDGNGYRVREYSTRPVESGRYVEDPPSPMYQPAPQYEQMPPPSAPPAREQTSPVYEVPRRYEQMPPPPAPHAREQTSPVYEVSRRYEQMLPPATPARMEQTSPAYAPRAYSVRPVEAAPAPIAYIPRQGSVAPVQYIRQEAAPAPVRAMSVAPGYEQPMYAQSQAYSRAPVPQQQHVLYVDQYGQEILPPRTSQASEYKY